MTTQLLWEDESGQTQSLRFDVVSSTSHEMGVVVTEHPVEEGADVADHARPELQRLVLEGFVSNTPLWSNPGVEQIAEFQSAPLKVEQAPLRVDASGVVNAIERDLNQAPTRATMLIFSEKRNRVRDVLEVLEELIDNPTLVRVETTSKEFENLVLQRALNTRTNEDGKGAGFSLEFKQLRFVKTSTVEAPEPAEVRGQAIASKGSQNGKNDQNEERKREKLQSVLDRVINPGNVLTNLF